MALLEPQGSLVIDEPAEIFGTGVFVLSGLIVSAISERMHRAMRFEREARLLAEQTTRAEQVAREATQRALEAGRSAQRAREEMLALVAHDLQDPLGVIDLTAGLIERLAGADEQVRRRTAVVHRTVQRMSRLVREPAGARACSTRASCRSISTPSRWSRSSRETVEEHEPEAQAKSVRLDHQVPRGLPLVVCDRDRVLQVLSNLVTNAVRFTPPGGRVELRAGALDGFVRVSVSDTGRGISAEMLPKVFERYSRERRRHGGPASASQQDRTRRSRTPPPPPPKRSGAKRIRSSMYFFHLLRRAGNVILMPQSVLAERSLDQPVVVSHGVGHHTLGVPSGIKKIIGRGRNQKTTCKYRSKRGYVARPGVVKFEAAQAATGLFSSGAPMLRYCLAAGLLAFCVIVGCEPIQPVKPRRRRSCILFLRIGPIAR